MAPALIARARAARERPIRIDAVFGHEKDAGFEDGGAPHQLLGTGNSGRPADELDRRPL